MEEKKPAFKIHNLKIENRKSFSMTGVKNVESFSDKNLIVEVNDERLIIEGEGINITNLDLESGSLAADGKINALKYASKKSAASFFKSIFK
ncbi:MAG: sporulation protein YabP [Clostridiales bacterium]|nr:sporulation protein YabP [Clostridiales bacterium]